MYIIQAVFRNLHGGWIAIGPGGLSRDVAPLGRLALVATSFLFCLLALTYESDHADSNPPSKKTFKYSGTDNYWSKTFLSFCSDFHLLHTLTNQKD